MAILFGRHNVDFIPSFIMGFYELITSCLPLDRRLCPSALCTGLCDSGGIVSEQSQVGPGYALRPKHWPKPRSGYDSRATAQLHR